MDLKSKIILISGPTASGKSNFSVKLAKKIHGEIINADSMQVYKELKILTARPSKKEYQNIKHHLYGFQSVRKKFSTGKIEIQKDLSPEDHAALIDIFDIETDLPTATNCNSIFKLDFDTPGRASEIEFICEKNYKAFDLFWNGLQGKAPVVGRIIGPYLTGNPIPTLPKVSP